jgi:hypothetical protein
MIDDLVKYCLTEVAYEGELGARCLHFSLFAHHVVRIEICTEMLSVLILLYTR